MKKAYKFGISGLVQGVGFRPFVYTIALREGLTGEIYNDDEGVKLTLCGEEDALGRFEDALFAELPPLARIDEFAKFEVSPADAELNLTTNGTQNASWQGQNLLTQQNKNFAAITPKMNENKAKFDTEISANTKAWEKSNLKTKKQNNKPDLTLDPRFYELKIIASKSASKHAPILPDFALCADCKREFHDPANPRYHYAFINCTNCGPRFSIIRALPYDRPNTTMSRFRMCPRCQSEYQNPLDRRYHAQPISCPNCGPILSLKDATGAPIATQNDAVSQAASLIKAGKILAVKGLGGFHLVCDATNETAVATLRERKNRPKKPFAVMCKDLAQARKYAQISDDEAEILSSNLKPIVVLKSLNLSSNFKFDEPNLIEPKNIENLAPSVAPNLNKIGLFLPYTGIHLLLFEELEAPIVATSANVSGEPIIYDEKSLREKLSGVIDFYLDHDREICSPSDDSIVFIADKKPVFMRTSRGVNPKFIHTKFRSDETILAVGAELKNQFAIFKDAQIMISPYIGDLKNIATYERFCALVELFERTYELKFTHIVADLHPRFLNLAWAREYVAKNGAQITQIQHHHAHLLSVVLEHGLEPEYEYLGFCFDGTGYGTDGTIWGGEVMRISGREFKRVAHFESFGLIGGESSIRHIWQIAYSIILRYDLEAQAAKFLAKFDTSRLANLKKLHERNISVVQTSSLGRIFDAFGSVILGLDSVSYEGEAGMELEALYDENLDVTYKFELKNGVINFREAFERVLADEPQVAASGFINGLVNLIAKIACKQREKSTSNQNLAVLLAGGVFQNQILLNRTLAELKKHGIKCYFNRKFCANDASIALGQLAFLCYF